LLNQHMADRLADNELCIRMLQQDVTVRCNRVGKAQAAAGAARSQPLQPGAFFPPPPPASEFTPAWAMLRGSETMLLDSMRTVGGLMGRGLSLQDGLQSRLAAAAPLTLAQRAWFADLTAYSEASLCAIAHLEGAAAALQLAPWAQYLDAVVGIESNAKHVKSSRKLRELASDDTPSRSIRVLLRSKHTSVLFLLSIAVSAKAPASMIGFPFRLRLVNLVLEHNESAINATSASFI
jgi:hypothetical protein